MINVHQVLLDYRQLKIKQLEIIQKEIITKWIYYKFKIQIGINQNNPSLKTALSFSKLNIYILFFILLNLGYNLFDLFR